MALELVRESIDCEQLLGENTVDTVIRDEYIIPDTHPDTSEILMLDAKPTIINKEVMQDKVYVEGQIEYNLLYLAKGEENRGIHNVVYTGKFSDYITVNGAEHKNMCDVECYVESVECKIVNDRKVAMEGIIKQKADVYKNYNFEVVKDVTGVSDIQLLKRPSSVDKVVGTVDGDILLKSHIQIPISKPQIGTVLKCDVHVHKKEVRLLDGKVNLSALGKVAVLYKAKDSNELGYVEDEVILNKEMEMPNIDSSMSNMSNLSLSAMDYDIKEDDLGEARILDVEALVKAMTKVINKEEIDVVEDAYSPHMMMDMSKNTYELNVIHGQSEGQNIVKGNIDAADARPAEIIMSSGNACVLERKIVEDKVVLEGLVDVKVLYKTTDENREIDVVTDQIPFTTTMEMPGAKIDMQCMARVNLESLETGIEANTIAVKAVVSSFAKTNYGVKKEFITDVRPIEGEIPTKKASITIYSVQPGDSLWKISKKYLTTSDVLMKVNEIDNPEMIKVGQKLIIPGRALL